VDYRALPEPDLERSRLGTGFVAPQTPTERQLAKIWQEVLKLDKVGIQDNFFDLGGHSLLAAQLVSRIETRVGEAINLRTFFLAPTVSALATLLATRQAARTGPQPTGEEFEL